MDITWKDNVKSKCMYEVNGMKHLDTKAAFDPSISTSIYVFSYH